ncbi:cytochrome b5 [Exidia glandulosa HHB12029]|uniref:Cytochrome b5 n=1 Tax=Exidia glandulosa HHB12029 TaxID=1314781 RepID=A0A165CN98_EXIGL|nr:cytochrome b5 [Exidia glandulosa HHB12029]
MGLVDTPVNALLALYIVYGIGKVVFPSLPKKSATVTSDPNESYTWMPRAHPPTIVFQTFTPKTLSEHNGQNGARILLAIKGMVFDVTAGGSFYGPGGAYGNFAGRDASRGMAKQSFEEDMLTPIDQPLDKLEDLTPSEIENMNGWLEFFQGKYIYCGELVENTD